MSKREMHQERVDECVKRLDWDRDKRQDFHRHLERNYSETKDDLEWDELWEIAQQFD